VLLAIETSTQRGGAAIFRCDGDGSVAAITYDGTRGHAEDLLFAVDRALIAAGASIADIVAVAVSVGPGSFTGVRTAVSTAKGLALARPTTIVTATSLEIVAAAHVAPGATKVAVIDAKRDEVYTCAWDATGAELGAPLHRPITDANAWLRTLPGPFFVVGDGAALLDLPAGTPATPDLPDVAWLARLGLTRLRAGLVVDPSALEPLYLRPPDLKLPAGVTIG
jgi:tRNA threonylcarbamoyladenosine biosynthesis protein TsaB